MANIIALINNTLATTNIANEFKYSIGNRPVFNEQFDSCSSLPDGQCLKPSHHNSELIQAPNSGQLKHFFQLKTNFFITSNPE